MLKFNLYEAVPEMNSRGEMGRVVVGPCVPKRQDLQETGKFYLCCKRAFLTVDSFEEHRKLNCNTTAENVCDERSLKQVVLEACGVNMEERTGDGEGDGEEYSCMVLDVTTLRRKCRNGPNTLFKCRKCPHSSSTFHRFIRHVKAVHTEHLKPTIQIIQDSTDPDEYEDEHVQNQNELKIYSCDMCNSYTTTYMCNIVLHKKTAHVVDGEYPCSYCTCRYETKDKLTLHMCKVHKSKNNEGFNAKVIGKYKDDTPVCKSEISLSETPVGDKSTFVSDWVQQAANQNSLNFQKTNRAEKQQSSKTTLPNFKCRFCPKLFLRKSQLNIHNRQRHPQADPKKPEERQIIKTKALTKVISSTNIEKRMKKDALQSQAKLCGQRNINKAPAVEERISSDCDLCDFIAKNSIELRLHGKVAHVIYGVECECGCSFATATNLTNHKSNECPRRKVADTKNNILNNTKQVSSVDAKYNCDCGSTFQNRRTLSKHKDLGVCHAIIKDAGTDVLNSKRIESLEVTPNTSNEYQSEKTRKYTQQNSTLTVGERKRCSLCKNYFKNDAGLRVHLYLVHQKQSYDVCEICNYQTHNFRSYKIHKKACHVKDGVKCPSANCSYAYKTIDALSAHFKRAHQGILDRTKLELKCNECEFFTFRSSEFEKHRLRGHNKDTTKDTQKFSCEQCSFTASMSNHLKSHIKTNHVENGFKCNLCSNSFSTSMGLRSHTFLIHKRSIDVDVDDYSTCKLCNYHTGNLKNYKEHYKRCHVGPIKCPDCVCTFKDVDCMSRHMHMLHKKKLDKTAYLLTCSHSDCAFTTHHIGTFKHHEKVAHEIQKSPNDTGSKIVKCTICGTQTNNLADHLSRAHVKDGFNCPEDCNCSFRTQIGLLRHMILRHKKKLTIKKERDPAQHPVKCTNCDFICKDYNSLNKHCSKMHGFFIPLPKVKRMLECDLCHAQISETLSSHKKRCHVTNGFKCLHSECSCSFETFNSRARHMMKAHQIVTTKRCHICKFKFFGTIRDHLKRCHVENGLKCEYEDCTCSFESEYGRQSHMRRRHNHVTSREPKPCHLCGHRVTETMSKHIERCHVENGLKCEYQGCACSFDSEQGRQAHMRRRHNHIVSKVPKPCDLCSYFVTENMSKHIERCHVENGLKCEYEGCTCSFESEYGRQSHMRRRHNHVTPREPKPCHLCGHRVTETLSKHIERCHVENGLKCEYQGCACSFDSEHGRQAHMRRRHNHVASKEPKPCHLCGYIVTGNMSKHIERCHVASGLPCSFCSCSFETEQGRSAHMKIRHNVQLSTNCTICGIIPVVSMNAHLKQSHVPGGLSCSLCDCAFKTERIRCRHLQRYHNITVKPISKQCSLCHMVVNIPMKEHFRNHHVPNGFSCKYCQWTFRSKKGRDIHMYKLHKQNSITNTLKMLKCKICGLRILSTKIKKHMELNHSTNESRRLNVKKALSKSQQVLRLYSNAQKNVKKNTSARDSTLRKDQIPSAPSLTSISLDSETVYSSQLSLESGKTTTGASLTTRDEETMRENEDGVTLPEREITEKEVESPSTPKEKLTCPNCGYLATCKSHLNIHLQKSHVKNGPFPCNYCSCSYSSERELVRHKAIFHSDYYR